jgi:ribosomal protein S18 acetylase RimI-like enzyme
MANSIEKKFTSTSVPPVVKGFVLSQVESPGQIAQARELFLEYQKALGISLCFQSFDQELAGLPGDYAPPAGRLLLGVCDGQLAGCVALHGLGEGLCEMKRLYLRPAFRARGLGRKMIDGVISEARAIGYQRLRLDTIEPLMKDAVALYRRMGFREITPYRENPVEGALYMELDLA